MQVIVDATKKLILEHVSKSYGDKKALDDVSLTLQNGVYGLLGPNGAGKSTLINIITTYLKCDVGSVSYNGADIVSLGGAYRQLIGYMPQKAALYEDFTLYTYLDYIAALKGVKGKNVKEEIERVLLEVNLLDRKNDRIGSFSGGMKQRASLAQAILGNPKILILDEPSAGLDPKERVRLRNMIGQLAEDRIVILATHIVSDIEKIADRLILIKAGHICAVGTPEELSSSINQKEIDIEKIYLHYIEGASDEDNIVF